jgi:hypothetical protein
VQGHGQYVRQIMARDTGVAFIDLDDILIDKEAAALIPPKISAYAQAIAYAKEGGIVKVAMVDPYDAPARTFLKEVLRGQTVEFCAVSQADFRALQGRPPQGGRRAARPDASWMT